jgi:hypothetical protein
MKTLTGVVIASALTLASVAAFAQATTPPPPGQPAQPAPTMPPDMQGMQSKTPAPATPPSTPAPVKYGPGWDAGKCASAKAQGQTVSKHDCPDVPAMPVPPK